MPPKSGKGKAPVFTRIVPKFLQAYSHLLTSDNKNYLGEELGHDDAPDDFMRETQQRTIKEHMEAELAARGDCDDGTDDAPLVAGEEVALRPFTNEPEDGTAAAIAPVEEDEEPMPADAAGSKGKIVFAGASSKKRLLAAAGQREAAAKPGQDKKKPKKALLSFDDSDEA